MKAPAFWSEKPGLPAWLLSPFAWLYGEITARRMAARGTAASVPVICIGNLTAGGAGKTPAVAFIADTLQQSGERPFVVSRGYGGRLPGPVRVDPAAMSAADCGDEPLLLARHVPTIVSRDRIAGADLAHASGATVVLLDDGLQNAALQKDFSLAVIDAAAGFGNGFCIPAGPLRAPVDRQMPFVDAVLLMEGETPDQSLVNTITAFGKPVVRGVLRPDAAVIARLASGPVLAFAGIGRPAKFFRTLKDCGVAVSSVRSFADHHPYSASDIADLRRDAVVAGLTLVTTEKDAMRLPPDAADIVVLPVSLEMDGSALISAIHAAIGRRRSAP
jgi:tetraacyldisaccharide 4'-kinase